MIVAEDPRGMAVQKEALVTSNAFDKSPQIRREGK